MREIIDFRIPEGDAQRYLGPSVGVTLGDSVRKVRVATDDPSYHRICEIDREFQDRSRGTHSFYLGWCTYRQYTKDELNAAEAFAVQIKRLFEPAGEECGTEYDESTACEICGAGATQRSKLMLAPRSLPNPERLVIAVTIAREIVVSDRFVELCRSHRLKGPVFRPVRRSGKPSEAIPGWHQLYTTSRFVNIVAPTKVGIRPTDDDKEGRYRCPRGDTIGLNLISELWISRQDFQSSKCDIALTRQFIGLRGGLLRPRPWIVVSPRFRRLVRENDLKGMAIEVAHLQ